MKFVIGGTPANLKDRVGQVFGKLTVLSRVGSRRGKAAWLCHCECGKDKIVTGGALAEGQISCGCAHVGHPTHGGSYTRTFRIWSNMKSRCNNQNVPAYKHYGGRGIRVCNRWYDSFEAFYEDMGKCPEGYSIERVNNDGNYEPSNCKWIPLGEQGKNKRGNIRINNATVADTAVEKGMKEATVRYRIKHNVSLDKKVGKDKMISFDGKTMNQKGWAEYLGVRHTTISMRIKKGWPISEVLRAIH